MNESEEFVEHQVGSVIAPTLASIFRSQLVTAALDAEVVEVLVSHVEDDTLTADALLELLADRATS